MGARPARIGRRVLSIALALLVAVVWLPAQPARGAERPVVVLTGTAFPVGFGPGVSADPIGLQALLWTPLVGFDARLSPYAGLASRVPTVGNGDVTVLGGGMRVTVHLKRNLRFSDGSPLRADDVLFGLRLNLAPALGNSFGNDEIAGATAPDPYTVVLTFHDLYGAYLAYAMPPAMPRAYFVHKYRTSDILALAGAYAHDPYDSPADVFSGPYRILEVAPGQRITLSPNPYFSALPRDTGLPRPEVRYVVLSSDESTLARDLHSSRAGVDVALGLSPASLPLLQGIDRQGLHAQVLPALAVEHLELNMATPALRDLRVRQALQDAIDKRALVRAVLPPALHPEQRVATSLIPSTSYYHDRKLTVSPVNLTAARQLLTAAGYAASLTGPGRHLSLGLVTTNDRTRQREADLLVRDFAAVGVRVTPRIVSGSPTDRGSLYAPYDRGGVLASRDFDLALFDVNLGPDPATVASLFDPARIPTPLSRGTARRNYTGIAVDALAMLPESAQASLDPASRKLGYDKLQIKVNTLLPYIVLYEPPHILITDGKVLNLHPAPQDGGTLWNAWEYALRSP